jgi:hypothetical protein
MRDIFNVWNEREQSLKLNTRIQQLLHCVGFEVLTVVSTKIAVFWVVAPCSLVEVYQRFSGPCCLHYQGDGRDDGGSKYL